MSVVIAVYNAAETLPELLASLADQDFDEAFEVIISDDCSTDSSMAITRSFARDLSLVICETASHRGGAATRNAGAAHASAPVLAFCDHDDIVHEAWVRSLCGAIRDHRLVAGAVHDLTNDGDSPAVSVEDRVDMDTLTAYYGHLPWSMTANLAVRRDLFVDVGGFSEELTASYDVDFCWRLAARGITLAYQPGAIVFKRPRSGAIATFRQWLGYGLDHPALYRRYRQSGMPRRSLPEAASRYAETAASVARALRHPRSSATASAAACVGQDVGRLVGSVRWRALYL
jgi:glycosyltransferase involved in cell wall biosynthesis